MNTTYDMSTIIGRVELNDVPDNWVFFHFSLKHGKEISAERFNGSPINIRSFWTRDSEPSLYFFSREGRYYFKCFSSGKGGGAVTFVKEIEKLNDWEAAAKKIKEEWAEFLAHGGYWNTTVDERFIVNKPTSSITYTKTGWTEKHLEFWKNYQISETTLCHFNVSPIDSYTITSTNPLVATHMNFPGLAFVFETKEGLGYQIYQPNLSPKYLNIRTDYYPGMDQIARLSGTLGIFSGLKDIMAFHELGLQMEKIAGRSETALIDEESMASIMNNFNNVISICDYDVSGLRIMSLYQKKYGVKPLIMPGMEIDVAENLRRHDKTFIKEMYSIKINKLLSK